MGALLGLWQTTGHAKMTVAGWVFLVCAWAAILAVTFFTFSKILSKK
jgi:hypothetical protein